MASSMSACFFSITPKPYKPSSRFRRFSPPPPPLIRPHSTKLRCGGTPFSAFRVFSCSNDQTIDETKMIRFGGSVESHKLQPQLRKRAMDAIDFSEERRVTVDGVATKTGLKFLEVQNALQALAADTNGILEVSDKGDVLYVFPKDYRLKLAAKSFRLKIEPFLEKGKTAAEYLVRVCFGTILIASIAITLLALLALAQGSSKSGSDSDDDTSSSSSKIKSDSYDDKDTMEEKNEAMKFFEPVFSFVFGDGDPNEGIEEERWKLIGQYIASNGGVVTAEELAPYLDLKTAEKIDDNSDVLQVLLRFDGQPEVDEEGSILYHFPLLQRITAPERSGQQASVGSTPDRVGEVNKFLQENKWSLSKASVPEKAMVIGLGVLNLVAITFLGTMLKDMTVPPSQFISFVSNLFPLLQIYAVSFFAIPSTRWLFIQLKNVKIAKRNQAREQLAKELESPDISLRQKLLSARDMAGRTFIGEGRVIYSTEKGFYKQ